MMKRKTGIFFLVIGSLFVSLLIVEISARIINYGQVVEFIPNENWGYLMRPSQTVYSYGHPVHINSLGLRGPEIKAQKEGNSLRILFVGDSVTYGGGKIKDEDLLSRTVESLFKKDNVRVETVNLSAPGWSPQNWIRYIEINAFFDADIVVMILPECDLGRRFRTMESHDFKEKAPLLRIQSIFTKIYTVFARMHAPPEIISKENVNANKEAVLKLMSLSYQKNIPFLGVLIPSVPPSRHNKYWPQFEAVISDPLDLRDELNNASLLIDGVHLNSKGHKLVGEAIYSRLKKNLFKSYQNSLPDY